MTNARTIDRITLCIAENVIRFSFPASFTRLIRRRYSKFITFKKPRYTLQGVCNRARPSKSPSKPLVKTEAGRLIINRIDFEATMNIKTGRGALSISENIYSFDSFLRVFYSALLNRQGGFLLHAAGLAQDGNGYIFSGVSGSGKSTLASLCGKRFSVLTDEISVLRPKGKAFYLYGTPFWGKLKGSGENISVPAKRLFFLKKGKQLEIRGLTREEAWVRWLRCVMVFERNPKLIRHLLQIADKLFVWTQPEELTFPKTSALPGLLSKALKPKAGTQRQAALRN